MLNAKKFTFFDENAIRKRKEKCMLLPLCLH